MTLPTLEQRKSEKYRAGIMVFMILTVFTVAEFFASQLGNWALVLIAIALLKAFLVLRDYMHIGKVFYGEEEE
ncbi:MAG: cytochrome C oxidase subunit IV family protein [Chloroflexota bacterium]